jgi:hypothetical protein
VLIVGHLPMPGQRGGGVRARLAAASGAAQAYLDHVLREAGGHVMSSVGTSHPKAGGSTGAKTRADISVNAGAPTHADARAVRWTLRREAYRTLAEARTVISLASAELPALARHSEGADEIVAVLERLVDTTTACAVDLDDSGRLTPRHTERLAGLLDELAGHRERAGLRLPELPLAV